MTHNKRANGQKISDFFLHKSGYYFASDFSMHLPNHNGNKCKAFWGNIKVIKVLKSEVCLLYTGHRTIHRNKSNYDCSVSLRYCRAGTFSFEAG